MDDKGTSNTHNIREVTVSLTKGNEPTVIKHQGKEIDLSHTIRQAKSEPGKHHEVKIDDNRMARISYSNNKGKFSVQIRRFDGRELRAKLSMPMNSRIQSFVKTVDNTSQDSGQINSVNTTQIHSPNKANVRSTTISQSCSHQGKFQQSFNNDDHRRGGASPRLAVSTGVNVGRKG
ncbi:hypothetical protein [Aliikangiella coralliicola]|uniref:Uncharacterized protein n=1 Tax=Aliikangiella coralliicola TaxID=2592383 RepID=A0A545U4I8_9GAMM|nr:hypothetical protein [Aliikangiella coralliicola]TQV84397.1 hypothetical protein FLL46_22505 [Aliikangiella coralliicola]